MFDDLRAMWEELGAMLADVADNFADMHPADVAEVLRNCSLKATELAGDIQGRREYILTEVLPGWTLTNIGADAGMPPAKPKITQPLPAIKDGPDIS